MAIIVEHDKRKKEILETALDLFMEKGYEDVTFQKIADRCGITRTTLYIYFKNKKEIFVWSIKQLTSEIEASLMDIIHDESKTVQDRLLSVLDKILEKCSENHLLFTVTLTYLLYSVIEAAIFRLAVLDQKEISELRRPFHLVVAGILSNN